MMIDLRFTLTAVVGIILMGEAIQRREIEIRRRNKTRRRMRALRLETYRLTADLLGERRERMQATNALDRWKRFALEQRGKLNDLYVRECEVKELVENMLKEAP